MKIDNSKTQLSTYQECLDFARQAKELDLVSTASVKNDGTYNLEHDKALEFIGSNKEYIAKTISGVVGLALKNR